MMWGFPGYGVGWLGMGLMMIVGPLLFVGLVLLLARSARGGHGGGCGWSHYESGSDQACGIAKQRYARGEITKEEYLDICRTVGG